MTKDARKLEIELRETLKRDATILLVDRVCDAFGRFEEYVRRNQLGEVVPTGGTRGRSFGGTTAAFMLQGIFPYSFRDRLGTQL